MAAQRYWPVVGSAAKLTIQYGPARALGRKHGATSRSDGRPTSTWMTVGYGDGDEGAHVDLDDRGLRLR
jgi:hypothetical protein